MSRPVLAFLLAFPFFACKDPLRDQCVCTLKACFEGVALTLAPMPDSARFREFSAAIAYGDTVEAASQDWIVLGPGEFFFTSSRLRSQRPGHAEFRIGYQENGAPKQIRVDTVLAWQSAVCNQCSGNSPSCKDDMAGSAMVKLDPGSRL
jgi:hypothetical protein